MTIRELLSRIALWGLALAPMTVAGSDTDRYLGALFLVASAALIFWPRNRNGSFGTFGLGFLAIVLIMILREMDRFEWRSSPRFILTALASSILIVAFAGYRRLHRLEP